MMKGKTHLPLAAGLGALALIRPVMSMLGLLERIGQPAASLTVTVLITVVWVVAVMLLGVENPVKTLLLAGVFYGIFAIVISAVMSPILEGRLQGPVTNPLAIVSVIVTNAVWGLIAGRIAAAIRKSGGRTAAGR